MHNNNIDAPAPQPQCLNCDTPLTGEYCSACGQKHIEGEINLGFFVHTLLSAITNTDSRIFRTFKTLILKPGHLAEQYVSGCRQQYINPLRLCLVAIGLYLALLLLNGWTSASFDVAQIKQVPTEGGFRFFSLDFYRTWYDLYSNHRLFIYLGAMPLAAMAIRFSFYQSHYNYVSTLTLLLYVAALYSFYGILLVLAFMVFQWQFFAESRKIAEAAIGLLIYFQAIKSFYHFGWLKAVVATLWVFLLLMLAAYIVTFFSSWLIVSLS